MKNKTNYPEQIIYKYSLTTDIIVEYVISKNGQCLPSESDEVITKFEVKIPCDDDKLIIKKLRFHGRFNLLSEHLTDDWGGRTKYNYRNRYTEFKAETYEQGFADAERYITEELSKLETLISTRNQKLKRANFFINQK